ncbi:phage tail assembly protein [Luteimonas soli]|uniref:Phage tail assembly protein n=1 Tax=Luteimonas soli TaxID=1648966 RepID=A0ABV7XKW7_9GAMM
MGQDKAVGTGTLRKGLKVGDATHKEFELRQCTAADYFAAEASGADSSKSITFQAALVAQQLVRIGEFTGPFTVAMLGRLHPSDLNQMVAARAELEAEGEEQQPG